MVSCNRDYCTCHPPCNMIVVDSPLCSEGAPDPPQNLALQPSSTSPSLPPVLSWQRPSNIPESVPLTYHLQIRNNDLKIEVFNGVFSRTDVQLNRLPEDANCSLFEFSVTASNDVGNSSTTSIMETVPISKFQSDDVIHSKCNCKGGFQYAIKAHIAHLLGGLGACPPMKILDF